jgi:hypothetical protein
MNSLEEDDEYKMNAVHEAVLTFGEPRPTTRRLAQYAGTRTANDDGLRMRENGGDIEASYKNPTCISSRTRGRRLHAPGHFTSMK